MVELQLNLWEYYSVILHLVDRPCTDCKIYLLRSFIIKRKRQTEVLELNYCNRGHIRGNVLSMFRYGTRHAYMVFLGFFFQFSCINIFWNVKTCIRSIEDFFLFTFERRSTTVVDFHTDKVALGVTLKVKILILH